MMTNLTMQFQFVGAQQFIITLHSNMMNYQYDQVVN